MEKNENIGVEENDAIFDQQMPTFLDYCINNELELPYVEVPSEEDTTDSSEQRSRTGAKEGLYPAIYYAGQYPALWKTPRAADSAYYQSINKKNK